MEGNGKEKAVGIDLGTTYSCVGVWQHDRVEIIVNDQGNRTTPSMVAFTSDERLVGDAAKFQVSTNPANTVFDVKRLIGRPYSDPCVQTDSKLWPFTVVPGLNDKPMIEVVYKGEKKQFAAEEISCMVLIKMRMIAEQYLNCDVKNAVITVPAYFNDSQKRATKDAGKIAGLNVMRIINEPTAAAITYNFCGWKQEKRNILVFDLGGGTFDVSIVTVEGNKIEVKAVGGDMHLGGEDFDNRVVNFCVQEFNRKYKMDLSASPKALRRIRSECERAKRSLSSAAETVIDIDCLFEGQDFHMKLRRAKFEKLNAELFDKCMEIVKQCLQDAKMSRNRIDDVVLVGGSSRIPKVQELLREIFDGKELCKSVNPDEAVAYGAAVEAAVLNKEYFNLVLMDVTPLSLGIDVDNGVMKVIVPRNTPIPTCKKGSVTTRYDNQTRVSFPVYEGERPLTAHNTLLGEFILTIPAAPCAVPNITVFFEIDPDGLLKVSARDQGTGRSNHVTITNEREKLSKEEIDRMVADAEKYRKEDEDLKNKCLARGALECYISNKKERVREGERKGIIQTAVADEIMKNLNVAEDWLEENESAGLDELQEKLKELDFP
ncbi:hypothetical protein KI387_031183 [Taxus chinensis]|uniref:Heat shock protein 70 n=1 Tax=Taxus chinensis TaxID=29808 RepID=A0AA38FFN2_TAXCH|nr:hypothetical protein KI387_031183 [Taxus chinensis]